MQSQLVRLVGVVSLLTAASSTSALADSVYRWDNGSAMYSTLGSRNQVVMVGFQAQPGLLDIAGIQIFNYWGSPTGHAITFGLWSDPTGDGNPEDASLIQSLDSTIGTGWQTELFPQVTSFLPGQWFFLGAILSNADQGYFITGADSSAATGNSWQYKFQDGGPVGRSAPGLTASSMYRWTQDSNVGGNLLIRAVTAAAPPAGLPEPSSALWLLGTVGALALRYRRRCS
ncbi:hypothetical protein F183_A01960 [Bryobacterales bacterium F-183]|nr:hypothetical protein F183_A01960 [Bryobacterales bacterium F-183]